jgi:glycosyltransferase involved in cell wall biosynthesis
MLVGGGKHLEQLRMEIPEQDRDSIYFAGFSDRVAEWISQFDVGILPSYFPGETQPNTIIEYLCLGKPVITTDIGTTREMIAVGDELAGFIVPFAEDGKADVEALAKCMLAYVSNPEQLRAHAAVAKSAVRKFDLGHCAEKHEALYARLMQNRSK